MSDDDTGSEEDGSDAASSDERDDSGKGSDDSVSDDGGVAVKEAVFSGDDIEDLDIGMDSDVESQPVQKTDECILFAWMTFNLT